MVCKGQAACPLPNRPNSVRERNQKVSTETSGIPMKKTHCEDALRASTHRPPMQHRSNALRTPWDGDVWELDGGQQNPPGSSWWGRRMSPGSAGDNDAAGWTAWVELCDGQPGGVQHGVQDWNE